MSIWTDFKADVADLERQQNQRALRRVNKVEVTGWDLAWFFCKVLLVAGLGIVFVILWLSL